MKEDEKFSLFRLMQKIPGGLIIIPMIVGVLVNTAVPGVLNIGGFTTGLFKGGTSALMGLFLVICGTSINVKKLGMPLYKGVILTGMKFFLGVVFGVVVGKICGSAGIFGITPMVLIATLTNSGGALYLSLAQQFGDSTDAGAISVLSLNDGPFFTLIAMGATGLASIPISILVATIIPIAIGVIWGNIDSDFKNACDKAMPIITMFMIIPVGASISFADLFTAGLSGILLGIISALTAFIFFFVYNMLLPRKCRNAMGAAIGNTAVNSTATPTAIAQADSAWEPFVSMATAQCATASIVTAFTCPIFTAICDGYMRKRKQGIYSDAAIAEQELEEKLDTKFL